MGFESTRDQRRRVQAAMLDAQLRGERHYHGTPCKHGHTLRSFHSNRCVECMRQAYIESKQQRMNDEPDDAGATG